MFGRNFSIKNMLITFLCISAFCFFDYLNCQSLTTYDSTFQSQFNITHIRSGDNKTFSQTGDNVTVNYNGTFPKTGLVFDSSYSRNTPYSFLVNIGQVIKCWDQVVSRMSLGERIYVVCPSSLAYGSAGTSVIPANTDIAFDIDLLCIANNCASKTTTTTTTTTNTPITTTSTNTGSTKATNLSGSYISDMKSSLFVLFTIFLSLILL